MSVYDYRYTSIEGEEISMSDYEGKAIIIVNTASRCGFAPQYEGLQALYDRYREQGLTVIAFPCNQFMDQEPDSDEEIAENCSIRFGVNFPLSQKVDVRGETAIPLFKYLTSEAGYEGLGKGLKAKSMELMLKAKYGKGFKDDEIKWNFTKFLVDRQGQVVGRFEPTVEPADMIEAVEAVLA